MAHAHRVFEGSDSCVVAQPQAATSKAPVSLLGGRMQVSVEISEGLSRGSGMSVVACLV